ncbi:unnamed protein product, partial [Brenthis ino]
MSAGVGWDREAASQSARAYPAASSLRRRLSCVGAGPCERYSVKPIPGPAIVARCKEAATVNPCAQGGEWRRARARWPLRPADSMRAAARRPAPT